MATARVEKLIVTQLLEKFLILTELEGPYPNLDESSPQYPILFILDPF
jgi:hypothetical protein